MSSEPTEAARLSGLARSQLLRKLLTTSALCTAALLAYGVPAQAQVIIDNRAETVIGTGGGTQASPWNISGDLFVGDFNSGRLDISAGGVVSNEDSALGGLSGSGTVTVDGTGSKWTNSAILNVGVNGTGTLSITNGGAVSDIAGHIASESGSNGTVTVNGAGSTWTNSVFLNVGDGGTGTLTIANGGAVVVNGSRIANIALSSGSTGTLNIGAAAGDTATGAGTLNAAELQFQDGSGTLVFNHTEDSYAFGADISGNGTINHLSGLTNLTGDSSGFTGTTYADSENRGLVITGQLGGSAGYVGSSAGSAGTARVFGTGASWTASTLSVGDAGTGLLSIVGGGTVSNAEAYVGYNSGATGTVSVIGTGSSWTSTSGFQIGRSGTGTLDILAGATVTSDEDSFIGDRAGSDGTMTVSGTGSSFEADSYRIFVGNEGTGALNIESGGAVSNSYGFVGDDAGSVGTANVDGMGSTWTNSQDLNVGHGGTGTLSITNGGAVSNTFGSVGNSSGSDGTVTVDGVGSEWSNSARLNVGANGTGTLIISNGGEVSNTDGILGNSSGGDGMATVTGAGSIWTNSNELYVGYSGTGELTIADDGTVEMNGPGGFTFVARNSGSTGTLNIGAAAGDAATGAGTLDADILVFGNGSGTLVFNHTEDSYSFAADISGGGTIEQLSGITTLTGDSSGFSGTTYANGGTLLITGTLGGSGGIIGSSAGTTGAVSVLGAGASWTTTTFRVADQGTGTLTIAGGGTVSSGDAWIGNASGAIGTASVTGTGSSLAASNGVDIGRFGTGTLNILDGATVTAGNDSFIGARSGSNGTVNVSGNGSSFEMGSNDLFVGDEGTGALNITDGGEVTTVASYIGDDSGSSGEVTVTGSGSKLTNSDNLVVGYEGNGTLNIAEGGSVSNTYGWIGDATTASGTANVDGDGSTWTNSQTLVVGNSGSGTLNITDGGAVSSNAGYVGNSTGANGAVTVDGTGSAWTNASFLTISEIGAGSLSITNGGAVSNTFGSIGSSTGSNGAVTVAGADSTWTNSLNLVVGSIGTGELTIANGGAVSAGGGSGNVVIANDVDATGTLNIGAAAADTVAGAGTLDAGNVIFGDGTGALVFNHSDADYEFAAAISGNAGTISTPGTGKINHIAGTTTLTGDSSGFSGTTTITGGFLKLEGTLGGVLRVNNGALSIENGGVANSTLDSTIGDDTGDVGFATVTGPGSSWTNANDLFVGDFGTGVLTILDGASVSDDVAYVGNTTDGRGTVTVNGTGSSWNHNTMFTVGYHGEGVLKVENGGLVSAEDGYIAYQAGSEGTVTVTGAGSVWDTDTTIVGDHGTGRITIADGGALVTTNGYLGAETGTGIATVTGSGSKWTSAVRLVIGDFATGTMTIADGGVVRSDAGIVDLGKELGADGTLNIGAAAGDAAVGAGTLDAEMVQFGQGAGTINFNHTDTNYEFAVDLAKPLGSGIINHIAGVTRLTGDASAFDGATNVTGGSLYVNKALGGTINVTGGTLGGSGTLGTVAIASGGTIAPGNSIGTLNVGDITIAAGSTYSVEVNSAGQSDLINATGTATINGGTVTVVPFPDYALGTTYTIVTAAGGITGTFDTVNFGISSLFISPTLTYVANNAFMTLTQTATFASVALTANQIAAAGGADSLGSGNAIFDAILMLGTTAEARTAFDAISGEIHASAKTALLEDSRFAREAAMDRLRVALGGAEPQAGQAVGETPEGTAMWAQGIGSWSRWGGDGNAANMSRTVGGLFMGADAGITDNVRLGLMGGYARSGGSVSDRMSSGTVDSYTLGAYAGGNWDGLSLKGGAVYSWNALDISRSVSFTGFSDSLGASYNARTFQAYTEAAYTFDAGNARFEPFANIAYVYLSTDGFTETGGVAALTAAGQVVNSTFTTIGIRSETEIDLGAAAATLSGGLGWRRVFGNTPTSEMTFASGGSAFTIAGVPLAQDSLVLDAGFDVNLTDNATLGLSYSGQFGSNLADHAAKVSLNVRF